MEVEIDDAGRTTTVLGGSDAAAASPREVDLVWPAGFRLIRQADGAWAVVDAAAVFVAQDGTVLVKVNVCSVETTELLVGDPPTGP